MKNFLIQTDASLYKVVNTNTNETIKGKLSLEEAEILCNLLNK